MLLRDAPEGGDRDRLLEELVERSLAEVAGGAVDRRGGGDDRAERRDGGERVGEDGRRRVAEEEEVARRDVRREASAQGVDESAVSPLAREVDREAAVRRPAAEEARRRLRRPAEERDLATGQALRLEGGDEGGLAVVVVQQPLRRVAGVEEAEMGRGEGSFLQDGPDVTSGEGPRVDDGDREADHAAAPAGGGVRRGKRAVASRATGAERA